MNQDTDFRAPTDCERAIFLKLLDADFPGKNEIGLLLRNASVQALDANGSLKILTHGHDTAPVVKRVPVEAEAKDGDGVIVHILLHVVDGKPIELEVFKEDSSAVLQQLQPSTFDLLVLPPRTGKE